MKTTILTTLIFFSSNSFSEEASQSLIKKRQENSARWNECKNAYKGYTNILRAKVNENKKISTTELKQIELKTKPFLENLVTCQNDNLYTETESDNILGGAYCLNFFNVMPLKAKSMAECKVLMKPDSF